MDYNEWFRSVARITFQENKDNLRAEIQSQVNQYLAEGNSINQIPTGVGQQFRTITDKQGRPQWAKKLLPARKNPPGENPLQEERSDG